MEYLAKGDRVMLLSDENELVTLEKARWRMNQQHKEVGIVEQIAKA